MKTSLKVLKENSWASQRGKTHKAAMEEYVKLVTEIAPQWKLANFMAGRKSDVSKPRRMMWVIRVNFADVSKIGVLSKAASYKMPPGEPLEMSEGDPQPSTFKRTSSAKGRLSTKVSSRILRTRSSLQATALHIVQAANESQTKAWFENKVVPETQQRRETEGGALEEKENDAEEDGEKEPTDKNNEDPFLTNLPRDLTLADCIVNVGEEGVETFKNMDEQNTYMGAKMVEMARGGVDKENGWTLLSRLQPEGVEVFERTVSWSPAAQLRSRWTTHCDMEKVAVTLKMQGGKAQKLMKQSNKAAVRKLGAQSTKNVLFKATETSLTRLCYTAIMFPWPLANRDMVYTSVYNWVGDDATSKGRIFVGYNFSSNVIPDRPGFVRAVMVGFERG